jgi:hypothetical protein
MATVFRRRDVEKKYMSHAAIVGALLLDRNEHFPL